MAQVCDARGEFDRAAELARAGQRASADPSSRSGARHTIPARIRHSSIASSPRSPAITSREFTASAFPRGGRSSSWAFLGRAQPWSSRSWQATPRVFGAGELRLVRDIFDLLPQAAGSKQPPLDCVAELDQTAIRALAIRHEGEL